MGDVGIVIIGIVEDVGVIDTQYLMVQ